MPACWLAILTCSSWTSRLEESDAQAKKRIHELLRTLKSRGVTVFIITHDREEAEQIADRVVRMPIAAPASGGPVTATVTEPAVSSNGPAHSVIHRLDPRVKMVGFLAAMFTMFAVNTPYPARAGHRHHPGRYRGGTPEPVGGA